MNTWYKIASSNLYHGSNSEQIQGNLRIGERDSGWFGEAFYLTSDPEYAKRWGKYVYVMTVPDGKFAEVVVTGNYQKIDFLGDANKANQMAGGTAAWVDNEALWSETFKKALQQMGYAGVRVHNNGTKDMEVAVFDPSNITVVGRMDQMKNQARSYGWYKLSQEEQDFFDSEDNPSDEEIDRIVDKILPTNLDEERLQTLIGQIEWFMFQNHRLFGSVLYPLPHPNLDLVERLPNGTTRLVPVIPLSLRYVNEGGTVSVDVAMTLNDEDTVMSISQVGGGLPDLVPILYQDVSNWVRNSADPMGNLRNLAREQGMFNR